MSLASGLARAQARVAAGDEASEYWDLTAAFDSGHRLFARFSISNEGPGDRTAYALGQLVFPDGSVTPFQNGRLEGRWKLSPDRLRMKVGSSVLDLGPALHHFEVDKNKKGLKIFFDFDPRHEPLAWKSPPEGLNLELLALGAPITGTIWVRDRMADEDPVRVEGRASLTHAWMQRSESDLVWRRIEAHVLAGSRAAYLVQIGPLRGRSAQWLVVQGPDGAWSEPTPLAATLTGQHPGAHDGYPIPRRVELRGDGMEGHVEPTGRILDHDPLSLAPRPLRWLLSLRADPLHTWLDARVAFRWQDEGALMAIEEPGLVSVYFTNPVSKRD